MAVIDFAAPRRSRASVRAEQDRAARRARRRPAALALATLVTLRTLVGYVTGQHLRVALEGVGCLFAAGAAFQVGTWAGLLALAASCWIISWRTT
jgi:hypothetical protein